MPPTIILKDLYLIVSIDVEEDMPGWKIKPDLTIRNLETILDLQSLFDKYNIRATYLLNYPFASNKKAIDYFSAIKEKCEIGAHMHPWNTPPLTDEESKKAEYPSNLLYERQFEKIKTVTSEITKAFGSPPVSYRAGRFGFNEATKDILARLGYLVDSSITPMVSWKWDNGPSFLNYRSRPFWMDCREGKILEVPVTIGLNRHIPEIFKKIYLRAARFNKINRLLGKDYLNLLDVIWLYPTHFTEKEMLNLVDVMIANSQDVFNVFFHSNEIKAGESGFIRTEEDVKNFFKRLEIFFDHVINGKKMKSVTLSQYRNLYKNSRES
jgi:hypothetical protein